MTPKRHLVLVSVGVVLAYASTANAQIVMTAFGSANVRTTPGFIDLDDAARDAHVGVGLAFSVVPKGWLGVEAETTLTPSAFSRHDLVVTSRLATASAGVLVLVPARWGWMLRPYFSLGAGVAQLKSVDVAQLFVVNSVHPTATASAGAWGWISPRIGIRAGVRFVRSLHAIESDSFETWQPSVGLSLRF